MSKAGKITTHSHMQQRIDTAENWVSGNPVLYEGEIGYESQSETAGKLQPPKAKVGDGKTSWNELPYQDEDESGFRAYLTSTVTIGAGEEDAFTYPTSENILTQIYEVSDGETQDNKNIAFDSADKYTQSNKNVTTIGNGKAELNGGIDPYTKLMLHFDGDNESTTITDSESTPKVITNSGVTISTAQYPFGTTSGYFNGSSYLLVPNTNSDLTFSGDFTVDAEIYITNSDEYNTIFDTRSSNDRSDSFSLYVSNSNVLCLHFGDLLKVTHQTSISLNAWHHVAIVRYNDVINLYLDGVKSTSSYTSSATLTNKYNSSYAIIGNNYNFTSGTLGYFHGYMKEFRISKDIARWTLDFTPPYAEYRTITANTPGNVTTASSSNYSLSKVEKINSITIPVITPTNTSVKILTLFDGRNTWLYHDNSGWHSFGAISEEWTTSNSNEELQNYFTNLSTTQLAIDLGYTPTSIDFIFQLETSDATVTPVVSALTMSYTAVGDLECADVGSYDDSCSRYGLKITSSTQLSVKNKDTASHAICTYIIPIGNITYLD